MPPRRSGSAERTSRKASSRESSTRKTWKCPTRFFHRVPFHRRMSRDHKTAMRRLAASSFGEGLPSFHGWILRAASSRQGTLRRPSSSLLRARRLLELEVRCVCRVVAQGEHHCPARARVGLVRLPVVTAGCRYRDTADGSCRSSTPRWHRLTAGRSRRARVPRARAVGDRERGGAGHVSQTVVEAVETFSRVALAVAGCDCRRRRAQNQMIQRARVDRQARLGARRRAKER
jgi:hypothetical protein